MVARATWKGTITFGLVSVPCRLTLATQDAGIKFNQLHAECESRIRMKKWCPTCDVEATEVVKGYDHGDKFVTITEEDLDELPVGSKKVVEVTGFVDEGELPPVAFQKAYYVAPEEFGEKGYALLVKAMNDTHKVAIGKIAFREGREHPVALRADNGMLLLETLWWTTEIRERPEIHHSKVSKEEAEMAKMLVESMAQPYDPAAFTDQYREALMERIEAKAAGKTPKRKKVAEPAPVSDIMAAMQASLKKRKKAS